MSDDTRRIPMEVLLRDLAPAELAVARAQTARHLSELGLNIIAEGGRSTPIDCTEQQCAEIFQCVVTEPDPEAEAPSLSPATDFGPVSGVTFTSESSPTIPKPIADEVQSVHQVLDFYLRA